MTTRRIPNFAHLLLFLAIVFLAFVLCGSFGLFLFGARHTEPVGQRLSVIIQMVAYLAALIASSFVFPVLWERPFLDGIRWNQPAARPILIFFGLALGFVVQAVSALLPVPKELPIDAIFRVPGLLWILIPFATLIAPLFEEMLFRGFLLPALAIAIDYLRLPRSHDPDESLATLHAWRASDSFSTISLVLASIITSLLFGLLHAAQLGFSWPSVALLAAVSLVLCFVRVRTGSVAASTLVHGSYNLSVFLSLFVATGGFRHLERIS